MTLQDRIWEPLNFTKNVVLNIKGEPNFGTLELKEYQVFTKEILAVSNRTFESCTCKVKQGFFDNKIVQTIDYQFYTLLLANHKYINIEKASWEDTLVMLREGSIILL